MTWDKLKGIKNKKQIVIIITVLLCVVIIGSVYYKNVVSTAVNYKAAVALFDDKEYDEAYQKFIALGDYKDSKSYAQKSLQGDKDDRMNKAFELMENEKYEDAIKIFESLGDYKGSREMIDKCTGLMELKKQHQKTDPLYNAYYEIADSYFKNYGKPKIKKDPDNKKSYTVVGVNNLNLIDLNNDNAPELVIGGKRNASSGGEYAIYTFSGNSANRIAEMEYNHHSGYYALEFFAADSGYQIYSGNNDKGELLSFDGTKLNTELSWENNASDSSAKEVYYMINGKRVSKKEYKNNAPVYNVKEVTDGFKSPFSMYNIQYNNYTIYPGTHLTKGAAFNLQSTNVMQQYELLKEAHDRTEQDK